MRKKISQKELAELRKKEFTRKELEFEVGRDLKHQYDKIDNQEKLLEGKNPYVIRAIHFFGTLILGYTFIVILRVVLFVFFRGFLPDVVPNVLFPVLQVFIWGASVIALVFKRSPLDDLIDWLN